MTTESRMRAAFDNEYRKQAEESTYDIHTPEQVLGFYWGGRAGDKWRAAWSACQADNDERVKHLLEALKHYANYEMYQTKTYVSEQDGKRVFRDGVPIVVGVYGEKSRINFAFHGAYIAREAIAKYNKAK